MGRSEYTNGLSRVNITMCNIVTQVISVYGVVKGMDSSGLGIVET